MRPGHHRPIGSNAVMRFTWELAERPPALGDIASEVTGPESNDAHLVQRSYLVCGVEEGNAPGKYKLVMERVEYGTQPASDAMQWQFFRSP